MFKKSKLILIFAIIFLILLILFFRKYISTNQAEQIQTDSEEIQITTEDMQNTEVYSEELGEEVVSTTNEDIDEYSGQNLITNGSIAGIDMSIPFTTEVAMPFCKIYVNNTSSYPMHVSVTQGSSTGAVKATADIPAGGSKSIYMDNGYQTNHFPTLVPGKYYVNFHVQNSYPMSGTYSIRVASTPADLN